MPAVTETKSQNAGLRKSISKNPRFAEEALRPVEEEKDQDDEGEHRLEARVEAAEETPPGREFQGEPEDEAPGKSAIGAADAAKHDGGEDQEQDLRADVRVDRSLDHGEHDAADPGEPAGEQ